MGSFWSKKSRATAQAMAPPKVYGWTISPFVSRVLLALKEASVDYELVPMSRQDGDHRRPEHLARNVRTLPRSSH